MTFPVLQSEQDYREALARLEQIFTVAREGTPEGDEFEQMSLLIADWERRNGWDRSWSEARCPSWKHRTKGTD